jgi:hypothetical protein
MLLLHGPRSLLATHWWPGVELLSFHVYAPFPVPRGLPAKGPACSKRKLKSRWTNVMLSTLLSWGPHSLSAVNYGPVSSFSLSARAGPKAAAVGDEEVGLPSELVRAQHAVILLQDLRHAAYGHHLSTHVQIVCARSPHVMLRTQAVGMKSLQAAWWPADLAPVYFNCWQSTAIFFPLEFPTFSSVSYPKFVLNKNSKGMVFSFEAHSEYFQNLRNNNFCGQPWPRIKIEKAKATPNKRWFLVGLGSSCPPTYSF